MLKHYYRLVYWKRRIARALGRNRRPGATPGTGMGAGARAGYRGNGRRSARLRQRLVRARPLLLFAVLVLIVVVASALLGWRDDTFGAGRHEGGGGTLTVRPSIAQPSAGEPSAGGRVITVSCEPRGGRACGVGGGGAPGNGR
ncbi:hypothetical protein [Streptomyces sp. WZ-12]|uniref:hypothetical protein n=1 Tax=Streptomyces sp. WZ-12 TaxID=3030210 RepID=UPI0023812FE9|nr:hypothetical protein [Streptomyces sp. WZ-12]